MSSAPSKILIVTTESILGKTCMPFAPILVAYCLSKSLLGDMAANVKNWTTGGELQGYSNMLEQAGEIVLRRMAEKAAALEADAVIGMRLVTSDVAEGAAELIRLRHGSTFCGIAFAIPRSIRHQGLSAPDTAQGKWNPAGGRNASGKGPSNLDLITYDSQLGHRHDGRLLSEGRWREQNDSQSGRRVVAQPPEPALTRSGRRKLRIAGAEPQRSGCERRSRSLEADVIVLAGDLAPYTEGLIDRVREHWAKAPHILYVLGNHEFYGSEIEETRSRLAEESAKVGIHLLDPGMVRIEGVRFIGATLWTDLVLEGMADEIGAHMRVGREISDFLGAIQHQGRDFTTWESVERHRADRAFIGRELEDAEHAGDRAVVITHHAPSPKSIRPWFEGDPYNCAFASDLDRTIDRYQPELWIHGHMHDPVDERLGRTRVLANPAGYRHEARKGFDSGLCVPGLR